jgi:hypothetical protein
MIDIYTGIIITRCPLCGELTNGLDICAECAATKELKGTILVPFSISAA